MRQIITILTILSGLSSHAQVPDSSAHELSGVTIIGEYFNPDKWGRTQKMKTDSVVWSGDENIAGVLMKNTGVFVRTQGTGGVGSISMRGTGANHTLVYWNGLNIQSPTLGLMDASLLSGSSFDEVSVNYGAAGLEYGSGGIGGVLHLQDKVIMDTSVRVNGFLSYGSFHKGSGRIEANIPVSENSFLKVGVGGDMAENDFTYPNVTLKNRPVDTLEHGEYKRVNGNLAFIYRPGEETTLEVKGQASGYDREFPAAMTTSEEKYSTLNDKMLMGVASFRTIFRQSNVYLSTGAINQQAGFHQPADSIRSNVNFLSWQSNIRQKWRNVIVEGLSMEWGAQFFLDKANSDGFQGVVYQRRSGVYANSSYTYRQKWFFNVMARKDFVDSTESPFLYAASVQYHSPRWGTYSIRTSRNFRFPTLNDRYWIGSANPDLVPEEGVSYEVSVRKDLPVRNVLITPGITAFVMTVDNWIQWQPSGNVWRPVNYKKVESRGIESYLSMEARFDQLHIQGRANYTYVISRRIATYGTNEEVGNDLIYTPRNRFSGSIQATWNRWSWGYRQGYTGRYFLSTDNFGYMPSYSTADILMGYRVYSKATRNVTLRIQVRNLYDWKYQVAPYRPEPGRNIHIQLYYQL